MKKILLATMIALAPAAAPAATLTFPSEAPVASITIPNSWGPKETEGGIDATSDDSAIYLSVDVADAKTSDKVISDAIDFLTENGVKIDDSTKKTSTDQINGMDMTNLDWSGPDKEGSVNIRLSFAAPTPDKLLVITYWGSKGTQEKHAPELLAIIGSLKPAAK